MNYRLIVAFIAILHLGSILNLLDLLPGDRVFPVTTVGNLFAAFVALRWLIKPRQTRFTLLDTAVATFGIWSIASVVLYFQRDNPSDIMAYFYGVHNYVMPMFGYFAIKALAPDDQIKVLRFAFWAYMVMLVCGLLFWWLRPEFYGAFLRQQKIEDLDAPDWVVYARVNSYVGSTIVGVSSAIALILASIVPFNILVRCFALAICLLSAIFSYQRGGIAATFVAAAYFFIAPGSSKALRWVGGGVMTVITAMALVYLAGASEGGVAYYLQRGNEFGEVFQGRIGYTTGLDYLAEFPLGVGIGGTGNAAATAGLLTWPKVVDANFMRIAADLGIQGVIVFIAILALGFRSAVYIRRETGFAVLFFVLILVALGTNVFDGHLSPQLFWICLGIADTSEGEGPELATSEAAEPLPGLESAHAVSAKVI